MFGMLRAHTKLHARSQNSETCGKCARDWPTPQRLVEQPTHTHLEVGLELLWRALGLGHELHQPVDNLGPRQDGHEVIDAVLGQEFLRAQADAHVHTLMSAKPIHEWLIGPKVPWTPSLSTVTVQGAPCAVAVQGPFLRLQAWLIFQGMCV
eukprot:scaffold252132_cov19-Tisochrysis_lutea.AAC.2